MERSALEEAKDWYKNNLWETTLAFAGGLDPDQVDYDAFFDGFMAAFYGNLSDIIDGDLLEIRIDEALGNQQSRALSMSSFKNDSFLEASTMNLRGLKRIGPPAPVKLSEAQCWTLLGDTLFDMIVLMITGIFGINDKSTRTVIKSTVNMSKFGPAFALTMTKVKAFDGKFIGDFFLAFASSVTVKDFASALYQNKWDIGVSLALAIIARLAAVWLTAGAALAFQLASIGWSVWLLWKNIDELRDGGCWDIFLGKTGCKVRRELLECNTSNPCLLPEEVCDKETASWTCAYEEKLCPPFTSCDKRDGLCKEDDELIPCVAVIDEDSSFGYPTQAELWQQFRDVYPSRPFCLLIPNPEDQVGIPQGFRDDPYTIIEPNIVRDDGNQAQASNWTELCGLQDYNGTSNSVGFVGIFVDNSGSMFKSEVLASYNNFIQDMADRHIVVKEVVNSAENWILPFLVTLVPPPDCVTRHNEKGTCITVSDCDVKEGTNVPWVATDPEPNCRLLPTNVQCCVPKTIII